MSISEHRDNSDPYRAPEPEKLKYEELKQETISYFPDRLELVKYLSIFSALLLKIEEGRHVFTSNTDYNNISLAAFSLMSTGIAYKAIDFKEKKFFDNKDSNKDTYNLRMDYKTVGTLSAILAMFHISSYLQKNNLVSLSFGLVQFGLSLFSFSKSNNPKLQIKDSE